MDRKLSMKLIRIKYIENTLSSCQRNWYILHIQVRTTRPQVMIQMLEINSLK